MMQCRAALLTLVVAATLAHPARSGETRLAAGDSCPTRVIGIDPSRANAIAGLINGEGVGQSFYASDTHIRSLTVWQPSNWPSGLKVYVEGTLPDGAPIYTDILGKASLEGKGPGDGVHPVPYVFEFHPPLELPRVGEYGFMLFSCSTQGRLLAVTADSATSHRTYPGGHLWDERHRYACHPTTHPFPYPRAHLIFQIVFQHSVTPEPIVLESAQTDSCWVRLVWSDGGTGASSATVMRRTTGGAWDSIGIAQADGLGHLTFEDATAELSTRNYYSLVIDECRFGGEGEVLTSDGLGVSFAGAELADGGVRLTWLADSSGSPPVTVYRRGVTLDALHPVDETWRAIGAGEFGSAGQLVFNDPNVMAGARYQYRLAVTRCGRERSFGLTSNVDIPPVFVPCSPSPVPYLVSEPTNCGVRLSWSWPYRGAQPAALYKRASEGGWTFVGVVTSDSTGQSVYEDLTARAGEHRVYRLGTRDCAAERFSQEVAVDVNGVVATDASARVEPDHVSLSWSVSGLPGTPATIYRRSADTDWQAIAQIAIDSTHMVRYQDVQASSPIPDGLRYRLGIVRCGREGLIGEVSVVVPVVYQLAITGLRPNPTERDLVVSFTLPDHQPARFDVLDVAGRRILSRDVGLGPGGHVVNLTEGRTLRSGMYVIRLSWAGQVRTTRALVVRQRIGRISSGF
jgi:hypothetical protein